MMRIYVVSFMMWFFVMDIFMMWLLVVSLVMMYCCFMDEFFMMEIFVMGLFMVFLFMIRKFMCIIIRNLERMLAKTMLRRSVWTVVLTKSAKTMRSIWTENDIVLIVGHRMSHRAHRVLRIISMEAMSIIIPKLGVSMVFSRAKLMWNIMVH